MLTGGASRYYRTDHGVSELDFPRRWTKDFPVNLSTTMAGRKTLLAPIHFIFSLLQKRSTVSIWLYEQLAFRIEGKIRVRFLMSPSSPSSALMSLGIR